MKAPITLAIFGNKLPTGTDILWMENVRFLLPDAEIDWNAIEENSPINEYRGRQLDWTLLTRE